MICSAQTHFREDRGPAFRGALAHGSPVESKHSHISQYRLQLPLVNRGRDVSVSRKLGPVSDRLLAVQLVPSVSKGLSALAKVRSRLFGGVLCRHPSVGQFDRLLAGVYISLKLVPTGSLSPRTFSEFFLSEGLLVFAARKQVLLRESGASVGEMV